MNWPFFGLVCRGHSRKWRCDAMLKTGDARVLAAEILCDAKTLAMRCRDAGHSTLDQKTCPGQSAPADLS